jgi:hypothetical protein
LNKIYLIYKLINLYFLPNNSYITPLCFYSHIFYYECFFQALHLWPIFGSYGDPPFLLCPLWKKNDFLWCYVKKRTISHDVMWDVFVSIVKDAKFHVLFGYIHIFLSFAFVFTSLGWLVVLMDGGCCLMSSLLTPLAHFWFCRQLYLMGVIVIIAT